MGVKCRGKTGNFVGLGSFRCTICVASYCYWTQYDGHDKGRAWYRRPARSHVVVKFRRRHFALIQLEAKLD